MRKRSASLLVNLLPGSGVIPSLDRMSELYQVSQRTLRSDLEEVNNFLTTIGQPHFYVDYLGVIKSRQDQDARHIRERLLGIGRASYKFAPDERQYLILAALLAASDYTTMEALADSLLVTRVTVLSDIEFAKAFLEGYPGARLVTRSSKGIRIHCDGERRRRAVLLDIFRKVVVKVNVESAFLHILARELGIRFGLQELSAALRRYETEHDILFSEDSFYEIALFLLVALGSHAAGHMLDGDPSPASDGTERLERIVRLAAAEAGVGMDERQIALTARDMDACRITMATRKILDIELYNAITYFLSKVGERFGDFLQSDLLLVDSLHKHIKSMSGVMDLGFDFAREKEFQGEYWEILEEINRNAHLLETYLNRKLSERMKLSIFIHICAALVRNRKYLAPLNVVVVCPGSMATGRLVEAQVRNFFDFTIRDVVPAGRVRKTLGQADPAVDFIIATVNLDTKDCPVVTVHPVLTMDDFNQIQKTAFAISRSRNKRDGVKSRIIRLVERTLDGVDDSRKGDLIADIRELAARYAPPRDDEGVPGLTRMLTPENVLIFREELPWRRAIRAGGGLLRDQGRIGQSYIEEMIANVEEHGPYIIIGGRIALAHAKPDDTVAVEGVSLVLAKGGIVFDGGERVYPMLCMSLKGDQEYVGHFQQIVRLAESGGCIDDLLRAETGEDACDAIRRHCGDPTEH